MTFLFPWSFGRIHPHVGAKNLRVGVMVLGVGATLLQAPLAYADVTTWLFSGFGGAQLKGVEQSTRHRSTLQMDTGIGSAPSAPVTVGLGVRWSPYFGVGSDFAAYVRVANQSYVLGGLGLALDGGGYARSFGGGSVGPMGSINLGLPWGFVVSGKYERGTEQVQAMSVVLGIDFLRLTVYRLHGQQEWPNVNPAWHPAQPALVTMQ